MTDPKVIVRDGYDRVSHAYRGDRVEDSPANYLRWLDELSSLLGPAGNDILDLGCGCGIPVAGRLASTRAVTGVDISPIQIQRARDLVPEATFVCGDFCEIDFRPSSFDAVVSLYAIIHVPLDEQAALFSRIASWLRPRGVFMATLGAGEWTGTEDDWLVQGSTMYWSHADAATYRRWLGEAGFEIVREEFVPEDDGGHQLFIARRTG